MRIWAQSATRRPNKAYLLRLEARLIRNLVRRFGVQMNWLTENIGKLSPFSDNSLETEIDTLLQEMPEQTGVTEDIVVAMQTALDRGGRTIVKQLGLASLGINFSLRNEAAIRFLEGKKSLELSNYKGTISGTTKARISQILLEAAANGDSYQKTAKRIMEQGNAGVFSRARAQLIAVREIGVAYEKGNNIPVSEFKSIYPEEKVLKAWSTVGDQRVTDECRANEAAKWIDFAETFTGLGSDSDKTAPRQRNPRCRCFTQYQIS